MCLRTEWPRTNSKLYLCLLACNFANYGLACCISGCKARLGNPRVHSNARPKYTLIESKTRAAAETQRQIMPLTEVDKLAVATDHNPLISQSRKTSLDKGHNAHQRRITLTKGMRKFDVRHCPGEAMFFEDTTSHHLILTRENATETAFLVADSAAMAIPKDEIASSAKSDVA